MNFYSLPETLSQEIDGLERLIRDRIDGRIDAAVLKAHRVPFGVYEQRRENTYMMRARTPGGMLTPSQLAAIAETSRRWGADEVHVTTRQEFQIHDMAIENLIPAMRLLVEHGLGTRGGGGNTVRNIVSSVDSGVDPEEVFDVAPHAAALTSRLISESDSWALPRKFKFAFSNSPRDTALACFADVGFIARERDGVRGFRVYLGGGMGAKSAAGLKVHDFIPEADVYAVARAARNLFSAKGNRRNRHRARFRFLREQVGDREFTALYEAELAAVRSGNPEPFRPEFAKFENRAARPDAAPRSIESAEFALWKRRFAVEQKQPGLFSVLVPLRLGKISADAAAGLARLLAGFGENVLRATREQNLKLRNIPGTHLGNVYDGVLEITDLAAHPRLLGEMIACAGADTCKLGICLSRGAVAAVTERLASSGLDLDRLAGFRLNLSGCPNACGQHVVADLGFFGRAFHEGDRYYPAYGIVAGARAGDGEAALARHLGDIPAKRLPEFTAEALGLYLEESGGRGSFADYLAGGGAAGLERVIARHRVVPSFEDDPDAYVDWGAAEPFTLAGRGISECSAGLFDLIEIDRKNIRLAREDLVRAGSEAEEPAILRRLVLAASRMLLITRGIDAGSDEAVFDAFLRHFIDAGLVDSRRAGVVEAARDGGDLVALRADAEALAGAVETLYEGMDDSLRFPVERATPSATASSPPPAAPEATSGSPPSTAARAAAESLFRDYRGVPCPINFVKVKLDLARMKTGERLRVLLDDGDPIRNVPRSAEGEGHRVVAQEREGPHWSVTIEKG